MATINEPENSNEMDPKLNSDTEECNSSNMEGDSGTQGQNRTAQSPDKTTQHERQSEDETEKLRILSPPDNEADFYKGLSRENQAGSLCGIRIPWSVSVLYQFVLPPLNSTIGDIADLVSDILVAASHYRDGNYLYFGLTIGFVFAPSLAMYLLALNHLHKDRFSTCCRKVSKLIVYSVAIWTMSLWPIGSYMQMFYFGIKALLNKEKSAEYIQKWKKVQDESLPAYYVIKAFLECAPQLALQLYIMLSNPPENQHKITVLIQIVSCVMSLISLAGKSIEFRRYIQEAEMVTYSEDRSSNCAISLWNLFLVAGDYLWWFSSIASRMIAIIMFASVFHSWIFLVCSIHVIVMVTWIIYNQANRTVDKFFMSLFVGIMYIFCFIEYKVDFGRVTIVTKYAFYYVFMICQNSALVLSAYFVNESEFLSKVHNPLIIVHFVAMGVDLTFMTGYLLHSKRNEILRSTIRSEALSE